jgi:hypothetical protein
MADVRPGSADSFDESGTWSSVRVTRAPGTTTCLGTLASMYLDLRIRRVGHGLISKPFVAAINSVTMAADDRALWIREPAPEPPR